MWASNEMLKSSIESYEEVALTMRQIGAAAGIAQDQVQELHESLANLSMANGNATIKQLDQLALVGAKLGGTKEQIEGFADAVSKITNGSNMGQVADGISKILSSTDEGIEGTKKLADALGALGLKARGGVEGLTQMTQHAGGHDCRAWDHVSEKMVGYAATFEKLGGRPTMAIMQFGMTLQAIEKQARDGGDGLKDLAERVGMSARSHERSSPRRTRTRCTTRFCSSSPR